jgi:toxin ParE1/3/4
MTGHFRLSEQAIADLEGIASYIGERNQSAAIRVLDRRHETFQTLAQNPGAGYGRSDLLPGLRIFSPTRPAHSYVIAFCLIRR